MSVRDVVRARTMRDPVALMVHSALIVNSMVQYAVVAILPNLQQSFGVSATTSAILLALPSLIMIVAAVPVGWLTTRWGARRVTLLATALLAISSALQAIPNFGSFTLGRILFGLSYTAIWTSGPAWLGESRPGSSGRVGAAVTSAAAGSIAGPLVAGLMVGHLGLASPFILFALVGVALTLPLLLRRPRTERVHHVVTLHAGMNWPELRSPLVLSALAAMVAVGAVAGAVQLLVPLQLHRAGTSPASLGLALSVSGVVFVAVSLGVSRTRDASVNARAAVIGCLVLAATLIPSALSTSSAVVIGCLLAVTVPRGQLNTLSYRLVSTPEVARSGNLGRMIGLLNLVAATSASLGSIAAGWGAAQLSIQIGFLFAVVWGLAIGSALAAVLYRRQRAGQSTMNRTSVSSLDTGT